MRNEACSHKQDQAIDLLNRLPSNSCTTAYPPTSSKRLKCVGDKCSGTSPATPAHNTGTGGVYHVQQGVIVTSHDVFDNQQGSKKNGTKRKNTTFVTLEEIQHGTNDERPYFPIDTLHHTQAWRQSSSLDQSVFLEKNKSILLDQNLQTVPTTNPLSEHRRQHPIPVLTIHK